MSGTVVRPRAFAVVWADVDRWSVKSFQRASWGWPEEEIRPLSHALERRLDSVDRTVFEPRSENYVTIRFSGKIEQRQTRGARVIKGKLFVAMPGDVIYSKIDVRNGAIGVMPPQPAIAAVTAEFPVYRIRPDVAVPEYIALLFRTAHFRKIINTITSGASGRKRVQPEELARLRVPLPAIQMQREIVDHWEVERRKVDSREQRAVAQECSALTEFMNGLGLKAPRTAQGRRAFATRWASVERWGVESARFASVVSSLADGRYPVAGGRRFLQEVKHGCSASPSVVPSQLEVLKISAVTRGRLDVREKKYMHDSERFRREFDLRGGDVLVCRTNGTLHMVGMSALVGQDLAGLIFPDKIIRLRCGANILPAYLWKALQLPQVRAQIEGAARTAVGNYAIGSEDLWNLQLPLPPLDAQAVLIARLEAELASAQSMRDQSVVAAAAVQASVESMIVGVNRVQGARA